MSLKGTSGVVTVPIIILFQNSLTRPIIAALLDVEKPLTISNGPCVSYIT